MRWAWVCAIVCEVCEREEGERVFGLVANTCWPLHKWCGQKLSSWNNTFSSCPVIRAKHLRSASQLRTKAPSVSLFLNGGPPVTFNFGFFGNDSIAAALICVAVQHLQRHMRTVGGNWFKHKETRSMTWTCHHLNHHSVVKSDINEPL